MWQSLQNRLVWSDVPNRRLLGWYPDGHVEVLIDGTWFMNGNAVASDGTLVHCEHGRRCISTGGDYDREPEPMVARYQGKRINSPNDVAVAPDGTIWFTDPTFGIIMPSQGALHRSYEGSDSWRARTHPTGLSASFALPSEHPTPNHIARSRIAFAVTSSVLARASRPRLRPVQAGSPRNAAETGSLSCRLLVRLWLLPTPPHSDAVTFGYIGRDLL